MTRRKSMVLLLVEHTAEVIATCSPQKDRHLPAYPKKLFHVSPSYILNTFHVEASLIPPVAAQIEKLFWLRYLFLESEMPLKVYLKGCLYVYP